MEDRFRLEFNTDKFLTIIYLQFFSDHFRENNHITLVSPDTGVITADI